MNEELERLAVAVLSELFRNEESGYAVLRGLIREGERAGQEVVLVGPLFHLIAGEEGTVEGRWEDHPRYGLRFAVKRAVSAPPTSRRAILAALQAVRHLGPKGASYLYHRYGPQTVRALEADPKAILSTVPGFGPRRLAEAVASFEERRVERALQMALAELGLEGGTAARIRRAWGERPIAALRQNPYALLDLPGVGFRTADRLAEALGLTAADKCRLKAAFRYVLAQAELNGHCYLPQAELEARTARLLGETGRPVEPRHLADGLAQAVAAGALLQLGAGPQAATYVPDLFAVEQALALDIRTLLASPPTLSPPPAAPQGQGFSPSPDQWEAIRRALSHRLSILTGGPGTGKTACLQALVGLVEREGGRVRLCAPTGKAARRLQEATGHEAHTVHRLLGWQPPYGFIHNRQNPLPAADLLVVDESSMLSVRLAGALFAAVGKRAHVLLVGDSDQLPAVGPGRVLEDLIASGQVAVTRLSEIFRQAKRSLIVQAAHAVNKGRLPALAPAPGGQLDKDFFYLPRAEEGQLAALALDLVCHRLPARYGLDPRREILVLAPTHRGEAGIDELNRQLRAALNPSGEPVLEGTRLRYGDRVIQTRNNYDLDVMNGELALLLPPREEEQQGRARLALDDGREVVVEGADLVTFEPAYAISIHKAQGSQAPAVVVVFPSTYPRLLTRNLLYTALTRAERFCVLVAQPPALARALAQKENFRRYTRLRELLLAPPAEAFAETAAKVGAMAGEGDPAK